MSEVASRTGWTAINAPSATPYRTTVSFPSGLTLGTIDQNLVRWRLRGLNGWHDVGASGSIEQRQFGDGAWFSRSNLTARRFVLSGTIFTDASDVEADRRLRDAATRLMASIPVNELGKVTVIEGELALYVMARLDGRPDIARNTEMSFTYSIPLVAPDPRKFVDGPPGEDSTGLPSSTGGLIIPEGEE